MIINEPILKIARNVTHIINTIFVIGAQSVMQMAIKNETENNTSPAQFSTEISNDLLENIKESVIIENFKKKNVIISL